MDLHHGNWQRWIWRLLSNPAIEVVATLVVVMVAAWFLIESGPRDAFPLFGRR